MMAIWLQKINKRKELKKERDMKKAIFINICILAPISIFLKDTIDSLDFITIIPLFAYIALIIQVKDIFISREHRIKEKNRALSYVLIVFCYVLIFASPVASFFGQDILKFGIDNIFLTMYLALIAIYFKSIFKVAAKEQK